MIRLRLRLLRLLTESSDRYEPEVHLYHSGFFFLNLGAWIKSGTIPSKICFGCLSWYLVGIYHVVHRRVSQSGSRGGGRKKTCS